MKRSYRLRYLYCSLALVTLLPGGFAGSRVNLSDYADLTDSEDDAAALSSAIADAGEGGFVYIPAGRVVLKSPVSITDQSITLAGQGLAVTSIEPDFSNGQAGLNFLSTASRDEGCHWVLKDFKFVPRKDYVGSALSAKDEKGASNDSRLLVKNVHFASFTKDFFVQGAIVDGMGEVDFETSNFIGELQDSGDEAPGRLTETHLTIEGQPSGDVSFFLCHLRMVQNQIRLAANFDTLYLRQLNMVQCGEILEYVNPDVRGDWVYIHGNALQQAKPLEIKQLNYAQITSSRFVIPGSNQPDIELIDMPSSIVSGIFCRTKGLRFDGCQNAIVFGVHTDELGSLNFVDSQEMSVGNNYSQQGNDYYPAIYKVSGDSREIKMADQELVQ